MTFVRRRFAMIACAYAAKLVLVAVLMCAITMPSAAHGVERTSLDRAEAERLFAHGNEVFHAGLAKAKDDYPAAESLFREAATAWRKVAEGRDVQNARLETNIGNASLLGGDTPRAIRAYRRALEIEPNNDGARDGLAAARRAAGTQSLAPGANAADAPLGVSGSGGLRGTLRQVGGVLAAGGEYVSRLLPSRMLLNAAVVCYVAVFALAIARVMGTRRVRRWMVGAAAGACVLCATPLVVREFKHAEGGAGVVVQAGVVARNGPAELYEPAFNEPLRAGLEVRVEETREHWSKVRLADGRRAWIPMASIEWI